MKILAAAILTLALWLPGSVSPWEISSEKQWVSLALRTGGDRANLETQASEPVVMLAAANGPPGAQVGIIANNFPARTMVWIGAGLWQAEQRQVLTLHTTGGGVTGEDGSLATRATIPITAQPGEEWVFVVAMVRPPQVRAVSAVFTITSVAEPAFLHIYTVRPGDIVSEIAARHGMSPSVLLAANPQITHPNLIFPGQRLVIPGLPGEPVVALSPHRGQPGTPIRVEVNRFPPGALAEVSLAPEQAATGITETGRINAAGRLVSVLAIPGYAVPQEQWLATVTATGPSGVLVEAVSNPFTVVEQAAPHEPVVTIHPVSGPPGTRVQVVGAGFPRYTWVEVQVSSPERQPAIAGRVFTEINGAFQIHATIPASAATGEEWAVQAATVPEPDEPVVQAVSRSFLVE